ncbi:MAG: hypothetical protein KDA95_10420, partial [Acidimicrobiales bacterium]|nr:hypothetical protein [Acidimicrobiales bacterium]
MSKNRDPSSLNRLRWNYLEMLKAGYPRLASVGSKDLDGLALNASPLRVRIHGGWKRELRQRSATFAAASRRKRLNYFDWDKVYASSPEFALSCNEFLIEGYEDILDEAPGLGTLSSFSGAQRHRLISWLILRQGG